MTFFHFPLPGILIVPGYGETAVARILPPGASIQDDFYNIAQANCKLAGRGEIKNGL